MTEITWSLMHPTPLDVGYMKKVIEHSKNYRVDSFEICAECHSNLGGMDGLADYSSYPETCKAVDKAAVEANRNKLREIIKLAHDAGKPVYYWHREAMVPDGLLADRPALLDENGEFDLLGEEYAPGGARPAGVDADAGRPVGQGGLPPGHGGQGPVLLQQGGDIGGVAAGGGIGHGAAPDGIGKVDDLRGDAPAGDGADEGLAEDGCGKHEMASVNVLGFSINHVRPAPQPPMRRRACIGGIPSREYCDEGRRTCTFSPGGVK